MRKFPRQTSYGGLIMTLIALAAALGVVAWLVADTPLDGGSDVATDPPPLEQLKDPQAAQGTSDGSGASVTVSPEAKGGVTADPSKQQ
ncbi:hypothetical protein FGG78_01860 [Thioclava sp. BHET1]|uniref:Uncharacterized protein n=1 Tax=Thioclava dalianensis TaxID=1185766 RepID=A0A074U5G2_9RHOB|nr:hypothetical protein [Thioclava dalianensis]KEP69872.1 hypothetical protein DL1_02110 [Thioclava dalianensis]TMV94893.1 hypothetical protein FGG78_01860 [Thioclava sp. BHET1]SFM87434.1 hypothetical protein SAMN05216224_101700 [Thioclava dalianensis]